MSGLVLVHFHLFFLLLMLSRKGLRINEIMTNIYYMCECGWCKGVKYRLIKLKPSFFASCGSFREFANRNKFFVFWRKHINILVYFYSVDTLILYFRTRKVIMKLIQDLNNKISVVLNQFSRIRKLKVGEISE